MESVRTRLLAGGIVAVAALIAAGVLFFVFLGGGSGSGGHAPGGIESQPVQEQPPATTEEEQPPATSEEEAPPAEGFPVRLSSGGTIHNAEMLYGVSRVVAWEWDFGDGNTSDEPNPTHVYEEPGTYEVTLTIEREDGTTFTDTTTITVP